MALADVLTRLVVIYLRGRRLPQAKRPPSLPSRPAPAPDRAPAALARNEPSGSVR
jgi:hypothetical protein